MLKVLFLVTAILNALAMLASFTAGNELKGGVFVLASIAWGIVAYMEWNGESDHPWKFPLMIAGCVTSAYTMFM
jgi:hypothetical protein